MYTMTMAQWSKYTDYLKDAGMAYDGNPLKNDVFIYKRGAEGGRENFHVHEFSELNGNDMRFTSLLPKSGSFRSGEQVNLANHTLDTWGAKVADMDTKTKEAVAAMAACFQRVGATYSA
ncbi:MAG TPA: hypothetical protein VF092_20185 [Longimicrobium sp.]